MSLLLSTFGTKGKSVIEVDRALLHSNVITFSSCDIDLYISSYREVTEAMLNHAKAYVIINLFQIFCDNKTQEKFKLVSAILIKFLFFNQMIALQKL